MGAATASGSCSCFLVDLALGFGAEIDGVDAAAALACAADGAGEVAPAFPLDFAGGATAATFFPGIELCESPAPRESQTAQGLELKWLWRPTIKMKQHQSITEIATVRP